MSGARRRRGKPESENLFGTCAGGRGSRRRSRGSWRALRPPAPGRRRRRRDPYAAWLDEQDARRPLTGAELRSTSDGRAEQAVAAGGGLEAVVAATGLRTRENVLRSIDPTILVRAFANDAEALATALPEREGLRRLVPDQELLRRRASGEPLRALAADYGVSHTSLLRWFARPQVARQLRELARRLPPP